MPHFTALAACDPQGVMGRNGTLPWQCPEELRHFRQTTWDHVMIMGYKTFIAMPLTAFEGRQSFVFSKNHVVDPLVAKQVASIEELYQLYTAEPALLEKTSFVIGGSEIFELFFERGLVESALISFLKNSYEGDTFFPLHFLKGWRQEKIQEKAEFSVVRYSPSSLNS